MGRILSTTDVAKLTGWSTQKIRALCASGKLPAVDTSTGDRPRWAIREEDLDEFLTPTAKRSASKPTSSSRKRIDADVAKVF